MPRPTVEIPAATLRAEFRERAVDGPDARKVLRRLTAGQSWVHREFGAPSAPEPRPACPVQRALLADPTGPIDDATWELILAVDRSVAALAGEAGVGGRLVVLT